VSVPVSVSMCVCVCVYVSACVSVYKVATSCWLPNLLRFFLQEQPTKIKPFFRRDVAIQVCSGYD